MTLSMTRCFWFDRDGFPFGDGCPKGNDCRFIHPQDRDFKIANEPHLPPFIRALKSAREREREHEHHRERDHDRDRDRPRPRSPTRTRTRTRTDSLSSSRRHMPSPSTPPPPPPPPRSATLDAVSRPTLLLPPPSSAPALITSPSVPTPRLPPPPPPPPPPTPQSTSDPLLSQEELYRIWTERVRLLAECVKARQEYDKIKEEIKEKEYFKNTVAHNSFPEEAKQQTDFFINKLNVRLNLAKGKIDTHAAQLTKANAWPVPPPLHTDNRQEVATQIQDLAQTATRLSTLLNTLQEMIGSTDDTLMDVDDQDHSEHPKKRLHFPNGEKPVDESEFESLRERITRLEDTYAEFENANISNEEDLKFSIEEMVENAIQRLIPLSRDSIPEDQLNEVREDIRKTGGDVEELAGEVANLILRSDAQQKELDDVLQKLNNANQIRIQQEQQLSSYIEAREKDRAEIEALQRAIDLYTTQAPPSRFITPENILHYIRDPVLDMVRERVQPLIEDLRSDVQEMLQSQAQEMYSTVWNRLQLTLKMLETISQQIQHDAEAGATTTVIAT